MRLTGLKKTEQNPLTQATMKQTMKLKNSAQGCKCTSELVLSANGYTREFRLYRCTKTIFENRLMNQHENNPDLSPPIVPGFDEQSCRKAKTSVTKRTPVKPACNVQHQLKADSSICSTVLVMVVQGYSMHKKRKLIFGKHAEIRNFMNHSTDPPVAPERVDTTEFRQQSHCQLICHEKTGKTALNMRICSFTNRNRSERIYLSKSIPMPYMALNRHSGIIISMQTALQMTGRQPFRWRKNSQLKWLEESSFRQEQGAETGTEVYNGFSNN